MSFPEPSTSRSVRNKFEKRFKSDFQYRQYVEENWGASYVQLSQEEIAAVRKVAEEAVLVGDRLPAAQMIKVQRETPPLQ